MLRFGVETDGQGEADDLTNAAGGSREVAQGAQRGACLWFGVSIRWFGARDVPLPRRHRIATPCNSRYSTTSPEGFPSSFDLWPCGRGLTAVQAFPMGQGMRAPKAPLLAQEGSTTAGSAGWLSWLSTGCTREASAGAKRRPRWGVRERSRRPLLRYFSQPGIGSRGSYSSNSTTSPTFPSMLTS